MCYFAKNHKSYVRNTDTDIVVYTSLALGPYLFSGLQREITIMINIGSHVAWSSLKFKSDVYLYPHTDLVHEKCDLTLKHVFPQAQAWVLHQTLLMKVDSM